uniref:ARAD1D03806p n=1 Tax=Blastobotrys adeninivorans TaxID=409370 RepID=A0A060T7K6_BLAAD
MVKLRIAVLQLNPRIGHLGANIERAEHILSTQLANRRCDLLVLPEFALTGYKFNSAKDIDPYLELEGKGPSGNWASKISKRLGCHTLIGYPERDVTANKTFNSASMFGPSGDLMFTHRKAFLYDTDEQFGCSEGSHEFQSHGPLASLANLKVQVGICMDLNPYKFQAPFDAFEFSSAAKENGANLVLCPMNWLHTQSPSLEADQPENERVKAAEELVSKLDGDRLNIETVNYWALRMRPFLKPTDSEKRVVFVACNRCGREDDVVYAGSSSIMTFKGNTTGLMSEAIEFHGGLSQVQEGLMYQEVDIDN